MENRVFPDQMEVGHGPDKADTDGWAIRTVVVDDSPSVLKALSSFLDLQHDFQLVGTAADGVHAVRRVVELEPDLVLMDLRLSGMNGLEATRQIKARPQAPTVIMVADDDTPESRAAASAAGTDAFVGKQHMFTQLRTAIRKLFPGATL
jgi:two-component system response regulator DesR